MYIKICAFEGPTETDKRKIKEKKLLQSWILETRKYIHLNKSIRRGADFGNQEKG